MKKQLVILLVTCLVVSGSTAVFAATTLHKLGKSPFHAPPLTSVADLQKMVEASSDAINKGFVKSGFPELYPLFVEQFSTSNIEEIEITPGEHLMWMLYRKNGKGPVRVAKDVTWAGDAPFKAYRLYLQDKKDRYEIVIPYICGNIALRSISEISVVPPANSEPTCRMSVAPQQLFCGDTITVDASGSTDSDGSLVLATIAMVDSKGQVVEEKTITEPPFAGTLTVPCGGEYTVRVKVTDNNGAEATSADCERTVSGRTRFAPVAAVGFMHLIDPGNFVTLRGGLEYWLNEDVSVMGMLGYNIHIDGNQGDDALSADLLGLYHFSRYYIGAGIGWWNMDDESYDLNQREILDGDNLDLILQAGARVYGEPNGFNVSVFGEARAFADSLDELDVSSRFTAGVLFHF